jgi:hypothetical protein
MPDIDRATETGPLSPKQLNNRNAYWRAANYLAVGQIYLCDNLLLREPLKISHIKRSATEHDRLRMCRPQKTFYCISVLCERDVFPAPDKDSKRDGDISGHHRKLTLLFAEVIRKIQCAAY